MNFIQNRTIIALMIFINTSYAIQFKSVVDPINLSNLSSAPAPWIPYNKTDPTCKKELHILYEEDGYHISEYFCIVSPATWTALIIALSVVGGFFFLCIVCNIWLCCRIRINGNYISRVYEK